MKMSEKLAADLPYLRRFARTLTGTQNSGDAYVRATLTAIMEGEASLREDFPPRMALYHLFHTIWSSAGGQLDEGTPAKGNPSPEERLLALPGDLREALLLTAVEGFTVVETCMILGQTVDAVAQAISSTQGEIEKQLSSRILIIEDESIIARDLANIVGDLGHEVVAIAPTHADAVKHMKEHQPGLILADINLGAGGSGLEAVSEILADFSVPVIFITAYPERLLTGERPEPTYLISKPFLPETVKATVGQALFFHSNRV
jgi:CheY-like chemotaxis protein